MTIQDKSFSCWCGNLKLINFSPEYGKCPVCETLVLRKSATGKEKDVFEERGDFYGHDYWFAHQELDFKYPNIEARVRLDLSERCLHWMRTVLRYKLPPAQMLEMGSAHGGFVALMHWAGYAAVGLEMSPWIVDFARRTFEIPILQGPIENQSIEPGTQDVIVLFDVLEHLPDPVGTMRLCLGLLKPNGIMIIQTPRYVEGKTYEMMVAQGDRFLEQLKSKGNEHLYLFSKQSIRMFFERLGVDYLNFEPAIFAHYDMFLILSLSPLCPLKDDEMEKALESSPSGRLVLALLDLYSQKQQLFEKYLESETDRAARLEQIEELSRLLKRIKKHFPEVKLIMKLAELLKKNWP